MQELQFIKMCRSLGLGLEDIKQLIQLQKQSLSECDDADNLIAEHLKIIEQKIQELHKIKNILISMSHYKDEKVAECKVINRLTFEEKYDEDL